MTHEINKEFNETYNFWIISCPEGCKITSWKEGDDIKNYSSFESAYCPKDADLSIYHCISDDDDKALLEKRYEEMNKKRI